MNDLIKQLFTDLGFDYSYCDENKWHTFKKNKTTVTFDDLYQFIAVDNSIGEYTLNYSDCELW